MNKVDPGLSKGDRFIQQKIWLTNPCRHQVEHQPAMYPWSREGQQPPGLNRKECCQLVKRHSPSPLWRILWFVIPWLNSSSVWISLEESEAKNNKFYITSIINLKYKIYAYLSILLNYSTWSDTWKRVQDFDRPSWFLFIKKFWGYLFAHSHSVCSQKILPCIILKRLHILQKTFCQINELNLDTK